MTQTAESANTSLAQRTQALGLTLDEITGWLKSGHVVPLDKQLEMDALEAVADLAGRIRKLRAEPSVLVVVFMGGTGVGKSTLLNALAGSKIADASMVRPTTTVPTVFHHQEVDIGRLDPIFAKCRSVAHDRSSLRHKILIDTPDIDGNVVEHRERLREMLPLADAVLYVGSQEKYHDREGWNLLLEHREARGFAFILNKWDRCLGLDGDRSGASPLDDLRLTLKNAGFAEPLLFRTCAGQWLNAGVNGTAPAIEDDFEKLVAWLDRGLDEAVVRAIKSRGIAGGLDRLVDLLEAAQPPSLAPKLDGLKSAWAGSIRESVKDEAVALVQAADRHASAFEQHLRGMGRKQFTGLFAHYLRIVDWIAKPKLPSALPAMPKRETAIEELADRCVGSIPAETRHALEESVHHRLLAQADQLGFPVASLGSLLPNIRADWLTKDVLLTVTREELASLERDYSEPSVGRAGLQQIVALASNWLPWVALGLLGVQFLYDALWRFEIWGIGQFVGALLLLAMVFVGLHFVVSKVFPIQWEGLRIKLERDLERRLADGISPVYFTAAERLAEAATVERQRLQSALEICRNLGIELHRSTAGAGAKSLFASVDA